jgi:hypothetical protein
MTNILLDFRAAQRRALSCVWIRTGDPSCPLVCKWVVEKETATAASAEDASLSAGGRLCA